MRPAWNWTPVGKRCQIKAEIRVVGDRLWKTATPVRGVRNGRKVRSRSMREILKRLVDRMMGAVEIKIFGDNVILDEGKYFSWPPLFSTKKLTPCTLWM
jgi:hypothetical protein